MALAIVTATPGQVEAIPADRCRVGSDVRDTELAMKAYREGKLPFPDGTIIARLARSYVPSEENNRVFGRSQSFVVGPATNVQFMVRLEKICRDRGLGVRSIQRRQIRGRGAAQNLLSLPRARHSSRLRLHSLCTVSTGEIP